MYSKLDVDMFVNLFYLLSNITNSNQLSNDKRSKEK